MDPKSNCYDLYPQVFCLCFPLRSFIVSYLTVKYLAILSLFLCMVVECSKFILSHVAVSFPSTTYWRDLLEKECLFSTVYSCLLCHRLIDHVSVGLFLGCAVSLIYICFCARTIYILFAAFFFFFFFFGLPVALAVPRPRSTLSFSCNVCFSSAGSFNPVCQARDGICVLMLQWCRRSHCTTAEPRPYCFGDCSCVVKSEVREPEYSSGSVFLCQDCFG